MPGGVIRREFVDRFPYHVIQLDELPETLRALPLTKLDLRWNPLRARPRWLDELAGRGCLVYV